MPVRTLTPEVDASYRAAGVWQDRCLYDVIDDVAARRPEAPAVADQHERLTYGELVRRSHALADYLLGLGLSPGAAVALQTPNRIALAVTHLACDRADLLFVPLSSAWRATEMSHLLHVSEAEVFIAPHPIGGFDFLQMAADLRASLPSLTHVGSLDGLAPGAEFSFDEVSRRESDPVRRDRDPNAPRFVMVTSGTTELPRLSLWSDNNLWSFMSMFIDAVQLTEDDIAVGFCPANTGATGYVFPVLGPLLVGASSVLLEEWSPQAALRLIESERATTATAVPTQVVKMLQEDNVRDFDVSSLRVFTNAGAAMPPHAAAEMEEVFGCSGHVCYGSTDGGVPTMTTIQDAAAKRHTCVGRVADYSEVRLLDPMGAEVPPGETGEIAWRSPTKSFGYLNDPERTEATWDEDGFYHSGDLGRIDEDGYLRIVGRSKDVIIRGGQNISPLEIETVLAKHPAVAEVSVIGIPDAVYGERTCACVTLRSGTDLTLAEVTEFLEQHHLARFKLPERLEVFDELPKSAGGKIRKVDLRATVTAQAPTVDA